MYCSQFVSIMHRNFCANGFLGALVAFVVFCCFPMEWKLPHINHNNTCTEKTVNDWTRSILFFFIHSFWQQRETVRLVLGANLITAFAKRIPNEKKKLNEWRERKKCYNGKFHDRITKANWWSWPHSMLASGMETDLNVRALPADTHRSMLFAAAAAFFVCLYVAVDVVAVRLCWSNENETNFLFHFLWCCFRRFSFVHLCSCRWCYNYCGFFLSHTLFFSFISPQNAFFVARAAIWFLHV